MKKIMVLFGMVAAGYCLWGIQEPRDYAHSVQTITQSGFYG